MPRVSHLHVGRRLLIVLLALLSAACAVASVATWHLQAQLLDEEQWVATSSEALEQPVVRDVLAATLVDRVYAVMQSRRIVTLRPGRLNSSLREAAYRATERALQSGEFSQQWAAAQRSGHRALMRVVRSESEIVVASAGQVSIELDALVAAVAREIGFPSLDPTRVPGLRTRVALPETERVARGIELLRWLDGIALPLALAAAGLLAIALMLAHGWRAWTLTCWGIGIAGAALALRAGVDAVGARLPLALATEPEWRRPIEVMHELATRPVRADASRLVWAGGGVALAAALTQLALGGRHRR